MKNRKISFIISIVFIAALLLIPVAGYSDAGGFAGDSDWDTGFDSGWDSGYDSDWDDYDSDWDDDYYGGGSYVFLGSGGSGGGGSWLGAVVIVAILFFVFYMNQKKKQKTSGSNPTAQRPRTFDRTSIMQLKEKDPNFSEEDFLQDAANLYVRLQNAWQEKDLSPVRNKLTDNMFAQFDRQLQPYITNGQTNHVENIAVLRTSLLEWKQDQVNDILTVEIHTRIVDYVTDDKTGDVIKGSSSKELFMGYEYTFIRSKDLKTAAKEQHADHCPNCGAPLNINHSGRCEYCGSVLSSDEYDWVVSGIKGLYQRS